MAAYLISVSAIQAAAPRGLAAGVVRARALLVVVALAMGVLGPDLAPAPAVALMAAGVAALVASGR